jgi:uncharacterized protein YdhG (YjbR/CyaY superfamily)
LAKRPRTIDEYLAGLKADQRAALQKLRAAVHAAAPDAEECIAWSMPGFRLDGRCFLTFRATAKHCSLHPMSALTVAAHKKELAAYDTSPGTIRFKPDKPLPASLVRKLVKARIAERSRPAASGRKRARHAAQARR